MQVITTIKSNDETNPSFTISFESELEKIAFREDLEMLMQEIEREDINLYEPTIDLIKTLALNLKP